MDASTEVGEIVQSQINIDIQTPINPVDQTEGIYIFTMITLQIGVMV